MFGAVVIVPARTAAMNSPIGHKPIPGITPVPVIVVVPVPIYEPGREIPSVINAYPKSRASVNIRGNMPLRMAIITHVSGVRHFFM